MNSSTIKNSYNLGEIYGDEDIGGVVGICVLESGFVQNSFLYNNYNASSVVEGKKFVGNFSGRIYDAMGSYNCCLNAEIENGLIGDTCSFSNGATYSLSQMQDRNSDFLTRMLSDNGTVNGKALWAQDEDINDGLPYLVNNMP